MKKLTNPLSHFGGGCLAAVLGFVLPEALLVFWALAVLAMVVSFEWAQYSRRDKTKAWNWLDSAVDIVFGYTGFWLVYWLIWQWRGFGL